VNDIEESKTIKDETIESNPVMYKSMSGNAVSDRIVGQGRTSYNFIKLVRYEDVTLTIPETTYNDFFEPSGGGTGDVVIAHKIKNKIPLVQVAIKENDDYCLLPYVIGAAETNPIYVENAKVDATNITIGGTAADWTACSGDTIDLRVYIFDIL